MHGDAWQVQGRLRERLGGGAQELYGLRADGLRASPEAESNSGDVTAPDADVAGARAFYAARNAAWGVRVPAGMPWAPRPAVARRCASWRPEAHAQRPVDPVARSPPRGRPRHDLDDRPRRRRGGVTARTPTSGVRLARADASAAAAITVALATLDGDPVAHRRTSIHTDGVGGPALHVAGIAVCPRRPPARRRRRAVVLAAARRVGARRAAGRAAGGRRRRRARLRAPGLLRGGQPRRLRRALIEARGGERLRIGFRAAVRRQVLGVDAGLPRAPAERAEHREGELLHERRRAREADDVGELAADERELQRVGHALGVRAPGVGQAEQRARSSLEARVGRRELDEHVGVLVARVPPVVGRRRARPPPPRPRPACARGRRGAAELAGDHAEALADRADGRARRPPRRAGRTARWTSAGRPSPSSSPRRTTARSPVTRFS